MNNLSFGSPIETKIQSAEEIRFVNGEFGIDRQVLSSITCCVCDERIWLRSNVGHMNWLDEAFKVADYRAYLGGVLPDFLKKSNVLLECHWTCQKSLERQLEDKTFVCR
jgi:hypothetical protein